jgi:hypothetical protein
MQEAQVYYEMNKKLYEEWEKTEILRLETHELNFSDDPEN